jgi:uncharacterized protein with GYD domain
MGGTLKILTYIHYVNLTDQNINTIQKNTETVSDVRRR